MDTGLKQRLIGAAVLVALAVIFLPLLVKGPAPDSGVATVPLTMPEAPGHDTQIRELPLVTPGAVPSQGALGMETTPVDRNDATSATSTSPKPELAGAGEEQTDAADRLPATTAGGDYAVHFGAYASAKGAETVVALAKAAQLPAYSESTKVAGKNAWRVRIGPYATRAEAEAARLKALEVRNDVPVRVVVLDAQTTAPDAPAAPAESKPTATEAPPAIAQKPATTATQVATAKPASQPASQPAAKPAAKPEPAAPPAKPKPVVVSTPVAASKPAAPKVGFAVQVGAFNDAAEASALRDRLRASGFTAFTETVNTDKGKLTRVRVGPALDRAAADQLKAQVKSKTGIDGFVRPHP